MPGTSPNQVKSLDLTVAAVVAIPAPPSALAFEPSPLLNGSAPKIVADLQPAQQLSETSMTIYPKSTAELAKEIAIGIVAMGGGLASTIGFLASSSVEARAILGVTAVALLAAGAGMLSKLRESLERLRTGDRE